MEARGKSPLQGLAIVTIVLVALALRLAYVSIRDLPLFSDEIDYDRLGFTLATTGAYSDEGVPTAYRPIGYPALVAATYAVVGRRPEAVHVVQAVLDAASALLLFLLAGGGRLGLLAAGLWTVFPVAILYTGLLMPETAFTTTLLAAACMTRRGFPTTAVKSLALGAVVGAAALIRPVALVLVIALPVIAAIARVRIPRAGAVLAGALLFVLPWIARNAVVVGYPGIATSTGANLLIGNNPNATGGYAPDVPPDMVPDAGPESRRDLASIGSALRYAWHEPGRTVFIGFAGLAHLFASEAGMTVWAFHPNPSDPSTRLREKICAIPWWLHALVSGTSMVVTLGGLLGFFLYPRAATRVWFLALLLGLVTIHFVFYGGSRYHFPLTPFLVLFTAVLLTARRTALRDLHAGGRTRTVALAVATTFLLGVWAGEAAVVLRL
ncbi:MAG TPA: hypothetical protein VFV24_03980 [Candidatus Eisenbacteria bacterium]|nr:hypothetical protein [Candidatus Eisenbacteria bacterium]